MAEGSTKQLLSALAERPNIQSELRLLSGADDGIRTRDPHLGNVPGSPPQAAGEDFRESQHRFCAVCGPLQPKVGWQNVGKSSPRGTEGYVNEWDIGVRYTGHVDYSRPVEAVIPGATGRLLAALARVEAEVPVSILASIAGVGRTRASGIIGELSDLGIVECREVGRTVLVSLARHSVAGELIDRLAHLGSEVIARLRALASELEPAPETLLVFGSFARGEADANSDLDILAVRSPAADPDKWAAALSVFAEQARELAGGPVQVLDYDLDGLRRKAGPKAKVGREFWNAVRRDAIVLTGSQLYDLIDGVR